MGTTFNSTAAILDTKSSVQKFFLRSGHATEIYLTAIPPDGASLAEQASAVFEELGQEILAHGAYVLEERIFATPSAMDEVKLARARALGRMEDEVPPTLLTGPGSEPRIFGVQVHAVAGCGVPEVLKLDGMPYGRVLRSEGTVRVALCSLSGKTFSTPQAQYAVAFEDAQKLLQQAGTDFRSVARTWWWLRDILDHYDVFNHVRRAFFSRFRTPEPGAKAVQRPFMAPASTGIGVWPDDGGACALDVMAAFGDGVKVQYFQGAGKQRPAAEYGSAFARSSCIDALGLRTVYVSGTADIDPEGRTCNIGNASAQIAATLENVAAVLKDLGCSMDDIVSACAYPKTPEIEKIWLANPMSRRIPAVTIVGDVCRDNLLFELEATALVRTPAV